MESISFLSCGSNIRTARPGRTKRQLYGWRMVFIMRLSPWRRGHYFQTFPQQLQGYTGRERLLFKRGLSLETSATDVAPAEHVQHMHGWSQLLEHPGSRVTLP
eukprot:3546595-Pyramimonas_sp.AAC.1